MDRQADQVKLKRLVAGLVAEELKKKEAEDEKGMSKLNKKFVDSVSVMGLSEAIKSKHRTIKALWAIIFVVGLIATAYFVYRSTLEYRLNPTATKVTVERNSTYSFPPIVLCLDTWLNARKATDMGLSKEAVAYALRYLMLFEDVGDKVKKSANQSSAEAEFLEVFEKYNFENLIQFYKHVAVDVVADSTNPNHVSYSCTGCQRRSRLEKVVMNKGVCHRIELDDVDGKLRQASGWPKIRLRVRDLSDGLVPNKGYWRLYIKPGIRQPINASPFVSIYSNHSHAIKITAERHDLLDKPDHPCFVSDPTARLDDPSSPIYSALSCSLTCARTSFERLYGCTVLNLDLNFSNPLSDYCNTYYWKQWPDHLVDENAERNRMGDCINDCPHECNVIMYEAAVDVHESHHSSPDEVQEVWKNEYDSKDIRTAKIYFINAAVLSGGVVTYHEVYTYSFDTLIGTIGGTCGIWIGASVMTVVQLLMFFLERALNKGAKAHQSYTAARKESMLVDV